jgi:L-rhamnose-H+ transport protein
VGFAIVLGLAAAVGTLTPLLVFQTAHLFTLSALGAIGGVAVIVAGVALCSRAEIEKSSAPKTATGPGSRLGVLLCMLSGIGGSMINLGLAFGSPIVTEAQKHEISPLSQTNAVWLPLLVAGFLTTAVYCGRLLQRNRTWRRYGQPGAASHWLLAVLMAALWFGSVELYGIGTRRLGNWGVVLGWPVFMSSAIITANLWGLFTGEWKRASYRARRLMLAGVAVVVASIFVVGLIGGSR